jgi:hypothetical protein
VNTRAKNLVTLLGILMSGRTALTRALQAREDGDRLEILDAVVNVLALITGLIVVVRRMRHHADFDEVEA